VSGPAARGMAAGAPHGAWPRGGPAPLPDRPARLALRILSADDVGRIHTAAIERLGADGAAAVAAARSAPSRFTLAGRAPGHEVPLGARRLWLAAGAGSAGEGGRAQHVRLRTGGAPVLATAADLDAACALADALPEVAVVAGPPVHAAGETPLAELARCFAGTSKHVLPGTLATAAEGEAAVAMATAVAGSAAELRRRPPLSWCGDADALPAALVCARAGLPVALAMPPGTVAEPGSAAVAEAAPGAAERHAAPPDVAAALVRHHAAVLAACAAVQAAVPGAPFLRVAGPALAGLPASGPSAVAFTLAAIQLAALVGLPVIAVGFATASHEPDWQACTEGAFAALAATAAGADVTDGAGTLGAGTVFSPEQLVMDSEVFSWSARIAAGIVVEPETLAVEAAREVGIGGNYLSQGHTRRHLKDVWRPRLLDRSMWDAWRAGGREGAYEKASALIDRLAAHHEVVPLGDEVSGTLRRIVAEAGL